MNKQERRCDAGLIRVFTAGQSGSIRGCDVANVLLHVEGIRDYFQSSGVALSAGSPFRPVGVERSELHDNGELLLNGTARFTYQTGGAQGERWKCLAMPGDWYQ